MIEFLKQFFQKILRRKHKKETQSNSTVSDFSGGGYRMRDDPHYYKQGVPYPNDKGIPDDYDD